MYMYYILKAVPASELGCRGRGGVSRRRRSLRRRRRLGLGGSDLVEGGGQQVAHLLQPAQGVVQDVVAAVERGCDLLLLLLL